MIWGLQMSCGSGKKTSRWHFQLKKPVVFWGKKQGAGGGLGFPGKKTFPGSRIPTNKGRGGGCWGLKPCSIVRPPTATDSLGLSESVIPLFAAHKKMSCRFTVFTFRTILGGFFGGPVVCFWIFPPLNGWGHCPRAGGFFSVGREDGGGAIWHIRGSPISGFAVWGGMFGRWWRVKRDFSGGPKAVTAPGQGNFTIFTLFHSRQLPAPNNVPGLRRTTKRRTGGL